MGALTSKPYAFTSRPWELVEREAFDIFDVSGSTVKLSIRGREIVRILPNARFSASEEWISDISRFSYDSISASSRLRVVSLFNQTFTNFSVSDFSKVWVNEFLCVRFSYFRLQDHFCLAYLRTLFFYTDLSGRLSSFSSDADFRIFPYHQFSQFQAAYQTKKVDRLFLFDFNVRYNSPSFAIKLRQLISQRPGFIVFNFGPAYNNLLGDVNLPYNQSTLVDLFRFKNRLSRAVFSSNSYSYFGFKFYTFFSSFISLFNPLSFSVFFPNASALSCFELGRVNFFKSTGFLGLEANFTSYFPPTNAFSGEKAFPFSVFIPLPHPYEDEYTYFQHGKIRSIPSPLSSPAATKDFMPFFPYYFKLLYFNSYTPSFWLPVFNDVFLKRGNTKFFYFASNYFSHFFSSAFQENSINILLNVKRHNEFRSNYIYYLRPCAFAWSYFANTFGCCVYDSF